MQSHLSSCTGHVSHCLQIPVVSCSNQCQCHLVGIPHPSSQFNGLNVAAVTLGIDGYR